MRVSLKAPEGSNVQRRQSCSQTTETVNTNFRSICKRGPRIGIVPREGVRSPALEPCKEKPEELLPGMQQKVTLKFLCRPETQVDAFFLSFFSIPAATTENSGFNVRIRG